MERQHELGRQRPRPLARRDAAAEALDAGEPGRPERLGPRPRLDRPALLPGGYVVQGGKDGLLRLLSLTRLAGRRTRRRAASCRRCRRRAAGCSSRSRPCGTGRGSSSPTTRARQALAASRRPAPRRWSNGTAARPRSSPAACSTSRRRRAPRLPPATGRQLAVAAARARALAEPDRRRRPGRGRRGQLERPRHERRARHLPPALDAPKVGSGDRGLVAEG